MRIHVATDHAGFEFSRDLVDHLGHEGHEVVNHGPVEFDPVDDYPSFCIAAARAVVSDQAAGVDALGVVFGGSGNGEQIAANKVRGARARLESDLRGGCEPRGVGNLAQVDVDEVALHLDEPRPRGGLIAG